MYEKSQARGGEQCYFLVVGDVNASFFSLVSRPFSGSIFLDCHILPNRTILYHNTLINDKMSANPRVAVVGGGIAGTLCGLVLKNRGLNPVIIDQGVNGLGGRLRGGAQFMRATDPRLQTVMAMLENANIIKPWQGRFGLLGSSKGGFLPAQIVTSGIGGSGVAGLSPADPVAAAQQSANTSAATDAGDFCQFVQGSTTKSYVGNPEMSRMCQNIADLASISYAEGVSVSGASMVNEGGWILETSAENDEFSLPYDGLVLASHNPSLASKIVKTIVDAEVNAGGHDSLEKALGAETGEGNHLPLILKRLSSLSEHLQKVRDEGRLPLYTVSCTYPPGFSDNLPFDAVVSPFAFLLPFFGNEKMHILTVLTFLIERARFSICSVSCQGIVENWRSQ